MDMDDPWGSPWADEIQLPNPIKIKDHDAARPATPVRASTLALEEKLNSPWGDGDDDGFGDWAALPEDEGQTFGLDGAADGWERHHADAGTLTKDHLNTLSTDWDARHVAHNEHISTSAPGPPPKPAEPMRQPSLDPWALDIDGKDEETDEVQGETKHGEDEATGRNTLPQEAEEVRISVDQISAPSNETLLPEPVSTDKTISGDDRPKDTAVHDINEEDPVPEAPAEPSPESQTSDPVSRPSSSPSERSHHDELLQESPRTSFDEEPKTARPQIPRKVSTKVQELVEHFDGLAKKEVSDPTVSRTSSAQGANQQLKEESEDEDEDEDEGEEDDFGDFEEGLSDNEGSVVDNGPGQVLKQDTGQEPKNEALERQHGSSSDIAPRINYGPVEFTFDTTKLETIFSNDIPNASSEKIFISDSIPSDSFSSTGERKTWYRISRYGTMRKHNAGNDDNYVRTTWKQSKIRDETLKIVSRWIEEDRISGRVVLGGGSKGSSAFGWNDLKTPAVPLSQVFAKHGKNKSVAKGATPESVVEVPREWPKGLVRDRSTSKTRPPSSKPQRKSSAKSVPVSDEVKNSPVAPVANFGWNANAGSAQELPASGKRLSGLISTPVPLPNSPSPPRKSRSSRSSMSAAIALSPIVPSQKAISPASVIDSRLPPAALQKNIATLPNIAISNIVNDDDDWGEMVSSPATPTLPAFPPSRESSRKKSQSIGGTHADSPHISKTSEGPQLVLQSEPSRRMTTSFDEILTPENAGPAFMSPQSTSNVNLFAASPVDAFANQIQPSPAASNSVLAASDPWASADFSFFDVAPAPAPKPMPISVPKVATPKNVKFNTPPPSSPRRNQRSREEQEQEQDRIVQSVVKGLPDLSYMLRN